MSVYQKYYINLESIKEPLIEGFVAIYGEKHRQTIIDRINNMYINTYITAQDLRKHMLQLENKKSAELTVEFLEKQGIELTEEQIERVLEGEYDKLTDEQKIFWRYALEIKNIVK